MTADMSISLNVVRCAVACCDSSRCSAIRFRRVDIFSRVSRPLAGAPGALRAGPRRSRSGTGLAGAGLRGAPRSITSGLLTTPPRPVPAPRDSRFRVRRRHDARRGRRELPLELATAEQVRRWFSRLAPAGGAAGGSWRRCGAAAGVRRSAGAGAVGAGADAAAVPSRSRRPRRAARRP